MKSPTKPFLLASVPLLCGGIWALWMLWRGPMLHAGLDRALGRLRQQGLATDVRDITWTSLCTAHIAQLSARSGSDTILRVTDIDVRLKPTLSFTGRDWVNVVDFGDLKIVAHGWEMMGKGRIVPATWALEMEGEFRKGNFEECENAAAGHFRLHSGLQSRREGKRQFSARIHIQELALKHPALGDDIKTIRELDAWARVEATANAYALRPGSFLRVGDAYWMGTARWDIAQRKFALQCALPRQPAQGLLAVAQEIAPAPLQGLRIGGQVQGYLRIAGDRDSLSALQLDGDLQGEGIALLDGGIVRIDTLRQLAMQGDMVSLDDLPQYLPQAVVLSEDANFWTHHGFDREVIRLAIAEDLEAGKFVRGAGTIPMQLMRNIYLHHGKQADRKLAEIALTWIAEQTHLLDKKTQLSLYLNHIEWGPNVFGIQAAAQYYFHKHPRQLSVDEAIFLACIIPNPLHAAELLEADGRLTPYAQEYYDSMRWMLYEADFIGEEWLEAKYPVFRMRA